MSSLDASGASNFQIVSGEAQGATNSGSSTAGHALCCTTSVSTECETISKCRGTWTASTPSGASIRSNDCKSVSWVGNQCRTALEVIRSGTSSGCHEEISALAKVM